MASATRQACRWPYAASSTGRYLGQLKLHILKGRVGCWEAVGQAREEFSNAIGPKLAVCIENNSDKLADSEVLINFALFMIGSSLQRTKPTIMFVSRDKAARLEARKAVQESGMLSAYPGFETGHCSQVAEFRDLRQFGGHGEGSGETVYTRGGRVAEGTLLFLSKGDDDEATPRAVATAGGFLSFGQYKFLLTVAHPFRNRQSQEMVGEVDENECDISGVEFSEDEEDESLADVTSRGSLTPEARGLLDEGDAADGDLMSRSDSEDEDSGTQLESSSPQNLPQMVHKGTGRGDNADIYYYSISSQGSSSLEGIGVTEYVSFELDYALIRLDSSAVRSLPMPSSTYNLEKPSTWHLGESSHDCSITLLRREGQAVSGNMSGNPIFTRLPGTRKFSRLYAALLEQHAALGDCGAWVRDSETGALLGHVVAGSDATGLALVMPAQLCFDNIATNLAARFGSSELTDAETIAKQNQKRKQPKIPSKPDWPKGQCRYIISPEIKGQRCACVAYTHNPSIPGSACDCGHLSCFHMREEMKEKADEDDLEALNSRLARLERIMANKSMAPPFASRLSASEHQEQQVERKAAATFTGKTKLDKVRDEQGLEKSSEQGSKTYQRVESPSSSGSESAPKNDRVVEIPRPRTAIRPGVWIVHISLLPHGYMLTPFERNTNAYQRCLSRGLHQMVVIHGSSAESFVRAVERTFGTFLQGRPWEPLQAKLSSPKEPLCGLATLRHLPQRLKSQRYTADFLRENCAVCDRNGAMDSIYIAMKSHTLSWRTLRRSPVFMHGLEECWAYDPLLDGYDPLTGDDGLGSGADGPAQAGDVVSRQVVPKRHCPLPAPLVELGRTTTTGGHLAESGGIPEREQKMFEEETRRSEVAR
ncbi:hypothetical protein QBC34DRAFT_464572 [Podospora aff. communis PSN243]|uniref:Uncharacterized protein n=1 Tax=Podospora aff. communis PSN243 TaxID=3040156 RepID=A0AAV9GN66_9PEZI|nr:hypothetical protein QBC34DRAFT_464572 [Podospora aff. communis PSN243]